MNMKLNFEVGDVVQGWTIISDRKHTARLKSGKTGTAYYDIQCQCGLIRKGKVNELSHLRRGSFHKDLSTMCDSCLTSERRTSRTDEQKLKYAYNTYKENARKRDIDFSLTYDEFFPLTQMNCAYCASVPSNKISRFNNEVIYQGIDRVDNNIGYTGANSVPCCKFCNIAKNDNSVEDFLSWVKRVHSYSVQRLSREGVGSSDPKQEVSLKESDIV